MMIPKIASTSTIKTLHSQLLNGDRVAEGLQFQLLGELDCCFERHEFAGNLVIGARTVVASASRYSVEPNSPRSFK